MTSKTYTVIAINTETETRESCYCGADLAYAAQLVRARREDGDGTYRYAIEHADGSPVTRGDIRRAGIKC